MGITKVNRVSGASKTVRQGTLAFQRRATRIALLKLRVGTWELASA